MKHGERVQQLQWINNLKIAIIEKDENKIEEIISTLPTFDSTQQMNEAAYMMKEAHDLLIKQKDILASKLLKIKKQKEYLNSAISKTTSFDTSL